MVGHIDTLTVHINLGWNISWVSGLRYIQHKVCTGYRLTQSKGIFFSLTPCRCHPYGTTCFYAIIVLERIQAACLRLIGLGVGLGFGLQFHSQSQSVAQACSTSRSALPFCLSHKRHVCDIPGPPAKDKVRIGLIQWWWLLRLHRPVSSLARSMLRLSWHWMLSPAPKQVEVGIYKLSWLEQGG